ncbi:MAG: hypothetical protein LC659_15145, partial [Myxococcales bacterium]|nr:hypothetical protein [Myxococcales bacterium]
MAYTGYHYYGSDIKSWSTGQKGGDRTADNNNKGGNSLTKDDFNKLGKAADPDRQKGVSGVQSANLGDGKLGRTLVIGINTWAGHTPGIVANGGLDPAANAYYKTRYGLDVRFVLIEDPAAKLTAFIKGDIDVMWDTVDSWAREASSLAENNISAKAIIQQDWSRGGDGIVSLKSINSVEDLKGKTIATTKYTPSH